MMQLPFRGDDGIFSESFIEERRQGLEVFINKYIFCNLFILIVFFRSSFDNYCIKFRKKSDFC